jgi:tRNA nucleotidyltransferase (CCA-adding enzyme)
VRDHLLGEPTRDLDIEVHGLSLEKTEAALKEVASVQAVGKSFGVFKATLEVDGIRDTIDVALPRTENKVGRGHRGFVVESDPDLPFERAALRRDFTINAMGFDLSSWEFLDPHGGLADLEQGILRHVSEAFAEDPLRVFRACQFAARFAFFIHPDTVKACRAMKDELSSLPKERLWEEWKKLILHAPMPSVGLCALFDTDALALFPELVALRGCPQEAEWHPEGDVWVHTLMVVDEAARLTREKSLDDEESLIIRLAALCHDLGKPPTTAFEDGRIRSRGHESAGEAPTRTFLERIGAPPRFFHAIWPLVRDHLKPYQLYRERDQVSDGALRRLATRVPIARLVLVSRADCFGRTTPDALAREDPASDWLLAQAERLRVEAEAPKPILLGRHLIEKGLKPGPEFGPLLNEAFEAQLEGEFHDLGGALAWLESVLDRT